MPRRKKTDKEKEADKKGQQRMEKFGEMQEAKKEDSLKPKVVKRIIAYQKIEPGEWGPLYED